MRKPSPGYWSIQTGKTFQEDKGKPSPGYWSIQTGKATQKHEETITRILEYTDREGHTRA